jgi:capsular polysaccharide biosynthesis protein
MSAMPTSVRRARSTNGASEVNPCGNRWSINTSGKCQNAQRIPSPAVAAMVMRATMASLLVAVAVGVASLLQTPKYEASAQLWVDWQQGDQQTYVTRSGEEIQTLPPGDEGLQTIILTMIDAIDSRPVAEEAIQRLNLDMTPAELLDNLTIEQVESTSFIVLTYEGTDPVRAKQIVNTVGQVSSELISERSVDSSKLRANVYEESMVPDGPVSPDPLRNGLLALIVGFALSAGLLARRGVLWP